MCTFIFFLRPSYFQCYVMRNGTSNREPDICFTHHFFREWRSVAKFFVYLFINAIPKNLQYNYMIEILLIPVSCLWWHSRFQTTKHFDFRCEEGCCEFRSILALWLKGKKGVLYLGVTHSKSGPICKCMYFCVYNYDCFVLVINHS